MASHTIQMPGTTTYPTATTTYPTATPYGAAAPKAATAAPAGGVYAGGANLSSGGKKWTKRALFSLVLRLLQLIFSAIGLAILASAHDKRPGFPRSLNYRDYKGYMWLMVMLVLVFVWSLITLIIDILEACTSFALGGMLALFAAIVEFLLAFLLFGAACSAATLDTDVVGGGSGKFSSRVRAATAFGFVTWLVLVPTMLMNIGVVITEIL